jgi:hypothetical protein
MITILAIRSTAATQHRVMGEEWALLPLHAASLNKGSDKEYLHV